MFNNVPYQCLEPYIEKYEHELFTGQRRVAMVTRLKVTMAKQL